MKDEYKNKDYKNLTTSQQFFWNYLVWLQKHILVDNRIWRYYGVLTNYIGIFLALYLYDKYKDFLGLLFYIPVWCLLIFLILNGVLIAFLGKTKWFIHYLYKTYGKEKCNKFFED